MYIEFLCTCLIRLNLFTKHTQFAATFLQMLHEVIIVVNIMFHFSRKRKITII